MRRLLLVVALFSAAAMLTALSPAAASHSFDDGVYIVTLRDGVLAADVIENHELSESDVSVLDNADHFFSAVLSGDEAASIGADSRISDIRKEMFARSMEVQTTGPVFESTQYPMPWGIDRTDSRTGLNNSYTFTKNGSAVRVYVVDSGVNGSHAAFGSPSRVVNGWSYRANVNTLNNYKLASANSTCPWDIRFNKIQPSVFDKPTNPDTADFGGTDNDGHGTHVAGSIAGAKTGIAQSATIIPVRVLDSCGQGTTTMILAGLRWIYDQHIPGTGLFRDTPAVINLSLGFESVSDLVDAEIQRLLSLGITVVAAAGNSTKDSCNTTPAGTPGTISIGAIASNDNEASYSNFGTCVDMFAPGSNVLSTWPFYQPIGGSAQINTYGFLSGTSMAAPHVAGAVAQFLQSKTVSSSLPAQAWEWITLNATCDAVVSHLASRAIQTPNRLLATEDAPQVAPCATKSVSSIPRDRSVDVSWAESIASQGSVITGYTATAQPGGQKCETTSLSCTITGLANKSQYTVAVSVTNAAGSRISTVTSTATPEGIVNSVVDLALGIKASAFDVSWKQGEGDGTGITYTATAQPGGITCTSPATGCTLSGLTNGTEYTVSVVGVNLSGTSGAVSATGIPNMTPQAVTMPAVIPTTMAPIVEWAKPAVDGVNVTYMVVAQPGGNTCTTTTTSCAIPNLVNGVTYTVTITGSNSTGSAVVGTSVMTPDGVPNVPISMKTKTDRTAMGLSWAAVTDTLGVVYTVTASPGGRKCTTMKTSCVITKLKNGTNYTFTVRTKSATGKVSTTKKSIKARPGFTVKNSEVKMKSRTALTSLLSSPSTGRKTWSETGKCSISRGRLVAPTKKATCVVTLRVARTSKYSAMSTRLSVVVGA
jgi:subtilisin family serine protease